MTDWSPVRAQCSEATVIFHDDVPGQATVINRSQCDHTYTLIVWGYRSDTDQRELAHHSVLVRAGGTALLSVGFPEECGTVYQQDVYMDLPPLSPGQRYSLSDVSNAVFWAPGVLWSACGGWMFTPQPVNGVLPPGVVPSTRSVCELQAFAHVGEMQVSGGQASIQLGLRNGYDNVVVYLLAYGSATAFPIINGHAEPTFPQTLVNQVSFVIRAGPAQTISIPVPAHVTAYQIDAGCVPGPATLHSRQDYPGAAFLEAAVRNNP
jgi:hypothetical protein